MAKVIINCKGEPALKEALRIVAFNNKTTTSALIVSVLSENTEIKKELRKMLKSC